MTPTPTDVCAVKLSLSPQVILCLVYLSPTCEESHRLEVILICHLGCSPFSNTFCDSVFSFTSTNKRMHAHGYMLDLVLDLVLTNMYNTVGDLFVDSSTSSQYSDRYLVIFGVTLSLTQYRSTQRYYSIKTKRTS